MVDKITWASKSGAIKGNKEYSEQGLAKEMKEIIESYTHFFGNHIQF